MIFLRHEQIEKVLLVRDMPSDTDPVSGGKGVRYEVVLPYATTWGIPTIAVKRKVRAYNINTGELIPEARWTANMNRTARELKREPRSNWYLNALMIIILAVPIFFLCRGIYNTAIRGNIESVQEKCLSDPRPGDVILVKVWPNENNHSEDLYVSPFKIERISADTIFVRRGSQQEKPAHLYDLQDWARFSKRFDLSEEAFSDEIKFYGIKNLQERKHRLFRPFRENETPKEVNQLDVEFGKTMQDHILEAKFFIRPR